MVGCVTNSIYTIYNTIYTYIKDRYILLKNKYNTINKYLLFRSKYLYKYCIKSKIIDSIDTKQVIDYIPKLDVFIDGTSYLEDKEYFDTIERLNNSIKVGDKVIDKRNIPKAYELIDINKLRIGEMDDFNIYGEMGQFDDSLHEKRKVRVQGGMDPAYKSGMEKQAFDYVAYYEDGDIHA